MANRPTVPNEGEILKGVFYDSPVEGLEYGTQTLTGMTNGKGEFQYRTGETVTFSIGAGHCSREETGDTCRFSY